MKAVVCLTQVWNVLPVAGSVCSQVLPGCLQLTSWAHSGLCLHYHGWVHEELLGLLVQKDQGCRSRHWNCSTSQTSLQWVWLMRGFNSKLCYCSELKHYLDPAKKAQVPLFVHHLSGTGEFGKQIPVVRLLMVLRVVLLKWSWAYLWILNWSDAFPEYSMLVLCLVRNFTALISNDAMKLK